MFNLKNPVISWKEPRVAKEKPTEPCVFLRDGECEVLTDRRCAQCSFHQTEDQVEDSQRKAYIRLCLLPRKTQVNIACRYYDGYMPWEREYL